MTDTKSYAATPRTPQWIDLSEKHERARERLREALDTFGKGRGAKSLNVVGPYGSGKSELMAWGFHYTWTELDVPAVFVNLETLLDCLPEELGPAKLVSAIETFLADQLRGVAESLESNPRPAGIHLAPDLRYGESFLDYFRELFDDGDLVPARIRQIIEGGRSVLYLDEIEQKYAHLMDRVYSDDRAPFREVIQAVDHGGTPYYIVGSFGLTSAYESVSDADTRREQTVTLPIPDASELARLGRVSEFRNFVWWASRGRPGWAVKLAQEWREALHSVDRMEGFTGLMPSTIERLPIVDTNALSGLFAGVERNRVITLLMKSMSPVPIAQVQADDEDETELLDQLPQHQFLVAHRQHLVTVDALCDAMIADLQALSRSMQAPDPSWSSLRYYLRKVLRATADEDDFIVFGGWRDKNEWAAKAAIAPLLVLLQDMILEFEGDRSEIAGVLSFIDRTFEHCHIVAEQVKDHYAVVRNFRETHKLFREVMEVGDETYISLAPKAVESLFPRMVARPLLRLHRNAQGSIKDQRVHVEGSVDASGRFLTAGERVDDIEVTFIFVPGQSTVYQLQSRLFSRAQRYTYMSANRVYVLLALSEGTGNLQFNYEINSDVRILQQEVNKLQQAEVGEQRLQDFLISLWHDALLRKGVDDEEDDIVEILDALIAGGDLSKSNRRKLEYYRNRLQQRLEDIAAEAARAFHLKLKSLFDSADDEFPDKRINEALAKVREARAVEQVALAFDVRRFREQSLRVLYELRQMENLRQSTKAPHGYSEFLETYAAVKESRTDIRPALNLKDIASYLRSRNDFAALMNIADDLGLDQDSDWAEATEQTERAPLLRLFADLTESQKVFVRGLSFSSHLRHNKPDLLGQVDSLVVEADGLKEGLRRLQGEVRTLNESLERDALSDAEVVTLLEEVKSLHRALENARDLPPAVLYILYRFSHSALSESETQRQRWSGSNGVEGWRERLRAMLDWREQLKGQTAQVRAAYAANRNPKLHLFGPDDELIQRMEERIEEAVAHTLNKLDKPNELSDPLPEVDLSEYNEQREAVRGQVQEITKQAAKVDKLAGSMEEIQQRVRAITSELGAQT